MAMDKANQKHRSGYERDRVWRNALHGRDGRRETLRICFELDLISAYPRGGGRARKMREPTASKCDAPARKRLTGSGGARPAKRAPGPPSCG